MNDLIYVPAETGTLRTAGGHLVVPVVALIGDSILHAVNSDAPEFVPASVLSSNVADWSHKPVVFNHPTDLQGRHLSASTPGILESYGFGTIASARVEGKKLVMSCHLDPSRADAVGAGPLIARLRAGATTEISVGCYVVTENTPGTHLGKPYARRWASLRPDHLACVERGACSCTQGCGMQRAAAQRRVDQFLPPDPYADALAHMRSEIR
ncbi:MAG: DUF2213 domain-containing protein [Vicinamibacterales bacterium]